MAVHCDRLSRILRLESANLTCGIRDLGAKPRKAADAALADGAPAAGGWPPAAGNLRSMTDRRLLAVSCVFYDAIVFSSACCFALYIFFGSGPWPLRVRVCTSDPPRHKCRGLTGEGEKRECAVRAPPARDWGVWGQSSHVWPPQQT